MTTNATTRATRQKAAREPIDWAPQFDHFQATVDWPGMFFWRELVTVRLTAKVILTLRDHARWYDRASETIFRANAPVGEWNRKSVPPEVIAIRNRIKPLLDAVMFEGIFQGRAADCAYAMEIFRRHHATVQADVPAERLLVYVVAQGREPLVHFLDASVPEDEPLPDVNDAARDLPCPNRALHCTPRMNSADGVRGGDGSAHHPHVCVPVF